MTISQEHKKQITLMDGILFIADPEHLPADAPLQEEDHQRGFAKTDHVAMVFTPYEYARCELIVREAELSIPPSAIKTVSFPIVITSGSCVIGDDIRPSEGCVEIALASGSYVFTVSLEVLSEDIDAVGNTAAIRFTVFIELMQEAS